MILFVLCRQQAIPVHAINLERHEDVLSQHLFKVVCLLFVAFRHDKPHQVLVQVVVHVDLVKLTLLNQAYQLKTCLQNRVLSFSFSWGV